MLILSLSFIVSSSILFGDSKSRNLFSSVDFLISNSPYYNYKYVRGFMSFNSDNWSIISEPSVIEKTVGKQLLGTDFSRLGVNGIFTQAYIKFTSMNWSFMLGRKKISIDNGIKNSIIHNFQFPAYDQFRFNLNFKKVSGQFFVGQLGSEKWEQKRIKRFIAGHDLSFSRLNDRLTLIIGEQVIFTGENRSVDLMYLNPLIPYISIHPDGDDLSINNFNNDNFMIYIVSIYKHNKNISFYGEIIIDDFQYREDPVQNMLGWKLGLKGELLFIDSILKWLIDYTKIDSWTYIHSDRGQFTTWQNRGHSIGYPFGGDLQSLRFQANSWIKQDILKISIEYIWMEKGSNSIQTKSANFNTLFDLYPTPPVKVFHMFESSLTYNIKFASLKTGYTNIPFPYEIANGLIEKLKLGFFFNLDIKHEFDIAI